MKIFLESPPKLHILINGNNIQSSSQGADNKKVNQIAENSADSHWKRKRVYSIIRAERKLFYYGEKIS